MKYRVISVKLNKKLVGVMGMFMIPLVVLANSSSSSMLPTAILFETFITVHMSLGVFKPLSELLPFEDEKLTFWILFIARIIFLLYCDFYVSPGVFIFDFFMVFIGAISVSILSSFNIFKKNTKESAIDNLSTDASSILKSSSIGSAGISDVISATDEQSINVNEKKFEEAMSIAVQNLTCPSCGEKLRATDKFCSNCGADVKDMIATAIKNVEQENKPVYVDSTCFSDIYNNNETKLLEEYIKAELEGHDIDAKTKLMPLEILKRRKVLSIIFAVLLFVYISMIFFHFPLQTYVIGAIILIIFYIITKKFNLVKMIAKDIKARPTENMNNIIMNAINNLTEDNNVTFRICSLLVAIFLPLMIFMTPKIMYEKQDNGYSVRFYAYGLLNFKTATIPEEHNGKKVISLRGNTFSNMPFLEKVTLPDSIKEIRGQAFKNDKKLIEVNIPKNLEYLGGGAFYNCISLKKVSLPDTLTYMGGETFYNATSLEYVKLSKNLTEIRGNTFENCTSLKEISIPDKVTRIGGHAFYGDYKLSSVIITENSALVEIGSSAFRECTSLKAIKIPRVTYVNDRAFKQSPTVITRYEIK